jgi:uncharacterized protein DUF4389
MTTETTAQPASDYPVRFDITRDASQNRITNFPLGIGSLIRTILLIPHLIILYLLGIVGAIVYFVACFVILFTGSYPSSLFNFYVGFQRWNSNVYAYLASLYDKYPPFSLEHKEGYPLTLSVDYPARLSRILNLPLYIGLLIKLILVIPHLIILFFLFIAAFVVVFVAQFAILFTGSFPEGMHTFVVGVGRWWMRVNAYVYALTDKYPPFSTR